MRAEQRDAAEELVHSGGVSGSGVQEPARPRGHLGGFGAFVMLAKINWGIGMQAMPYFLHCAGFWTGVVFFILTMVLAADSASLVARVRSCAEASAGPVGTCAPAESNNYTGLMRMYLGSGGVLAANFSQLLANWGSSVGWMKYIGDNCARFLPGAGLSGSAWVGTFTVPLLLCVFVDDVTPLERLSFVGLLAGQAFALLTVGKAASAGEGLLSELPEYVAAEPLVRWGTVPVAMGLAVFCNEGMVILTPSVHSAMRQPKRNFFVALLAMTGYFTVNYLAVAIAGGLLCYAQGRDVPSEITLAFDATGFDRGVVLLYVVQLLLTFPVVLFIVFESLETAWLSQAGWQQRRSVRAMLIIAAGLVATEVPRFGDFIAVAGGLGNSLGIYILPNLAALQADRQGLFKMSILRRVLSMSSVVLFGIAAGALSTIVSFAQLVGE